MPPTKAMTRPTTAPHGIASHTFCDVLFCESSAVIAEILALSDTGLEEADLEEAFEPEIFCLIRSSLASRLKGFSS